MASVEFRPLPAWPYPPNEKRPDQFRAPYDKTIKHLRRELALIKAERCLVGVVSPDVRADGTGFKGDARVRHPGAEVSFDMPSGPGFRRVTLHTDAFRDYVNRDSFNSNLRAIALGMEALRMVDRYGIAPGGQQYTGFAALEAGPGLVERGAALAERYGSWQAALRATHQDTGAAEHSILDFQAVVAYRDSLKGAPGV